MKRFYPIALSALISFAVGMALPVFKSDNARSPAPAPTKVITREPSVSIATLTPGSSMLALAERGALLNKSEWPAFLSAQLDSPAQSRLTAQLWAEADPAGFWAWLRSDFDLLRFSEFAPDLLRTWTNADPEAAMDAVSAITDKRLGGELRIVVIDTAFHEDVELGVKLAKRAGDFNSFGWGPREWMKDDPATAVTALGTLPLISDYRRFLTYAVPIWSESDPSAALDWMATAEFYTSRPGIGGDEWLMAGFETAAKADPSSALATAKSLDPQKRHQALSGVIASGTLDIDSLKEVLRELPPSSTRMIAADLVSARPSASLADLQQTAELLEELPSEKNNLRGASNLARSWVEIDRDSGWQWASSLTDPSMRRTALVEFAPSATPQEVASLPPLALSNDFFERALSGLSADKRDAWISQLPADRRAWAEAVAP